MKITGRRGLAILLAIAILAVAVRALLPGPIPVETAPAAAGALAVSIDEEGRTRARDRCTVAAPTAGRLERIALRAGDPVSRGQRLAVLELAPLDPREREVAEGKLRAAQALRREAGENLDHAQAAAAQAARERERAERLHREGYIALQEFEQAGSSETAAAKGAQAARFRVEAAASEVAVAQAALLAGAAGEHRRLTLRAPIDGRVLRVLEENERVIPVGTPILELGDPSRLEIVVEVLSTDAVRVRPGMSVQIAGWGGEGTLPATVRVVEPAGFTKVSALGVEEQRVNVIADLGAPSGALGDGYRVEVRIVTWTAEAVLKVPASALFRRAAVSGASPGAGAAPAGAQDWAVFVVAQGRALLRPVTAGHRTAAEVEILAGLAAGERVVLHPSNELRDGARVTSR